MFGSRLIAPAWTAWRRTIQSAPQLSALVESMADLRQQIRDAVNPDDSAVLDELCRSYFAIAVEAIDQAIVRNDPAGVAEAVSIVLDLEPEEVAEQGAFRDAYWHGFQWYYADRARQPARTLVMTVEDAIARWAKVPQPDLDILCDLTDFHFHAIWSFSSSSIEQCRRALPALSIAGEAMARSAATGERSRLSELPYDHAPIHVGYLAMFADPIDPIANDLRQFAIASSAQNSHFRLTVYAWCNVAPDFVDWLRGLGVACHILTASRPTDLVDVIEAAIFSDPPVILISDINAGVPTAVFARRVAPVQVFLQAGMPGWPVPNLDGVFNSFGFSAKIAGWGDAHVFDFSSPWDLETLTPPENADEVAHELADLPEGFRLIGCYGRLIKITEPYLMAVEQILQHCRDVAFVTGGSGDAQPIRAFVSRSQVRKRMYVREGFVPGHSWDRFLEVFLDTWPMTGGMSCREMIAKGGPVVTMHSEEMPAIDQQRDAILVAQDWKQYVRIAVRLLKSKEDLDAARSRACLLAQIMADQPAFAERLATNFDSMIGYARHAGRILTSP